MRIKHEHEEFWNNPFSIVVGTDKSAYNVNEVLESYFTPSNIISLAKYEYNFSDPNIHYNKTLYDRATLRFGMG